jgi:hypothetical protein
MKVNNLQVVSTKVSCLAFQTYNFESQLQEWLHFSTERLKYVSSKMGFFPGKELHKIVQSFTQEQARGNLKCIGQIEVD